MMTYEEYASEFVEELKKQMPDANIERHGVRRVNGERDGVAVREPGSPVAPTVYIEELYQSYKDTGMSAEEGAEWATDYITKMKPEMPKFNVNSFNDAEHKLYTSIVCKDKNKELLSSAPHRDLEGTDLALLARYRIDDNGSFLVNNSNFNVLGCKDADEVMSKAMANSAREQFFCKGMTKMFDDIITEGTEEELLPKMNEQEAMYILTNKDMINGATMIAFPDVMKKATEVIGEDKCYILPSSVHEVILVPESFGKDIGAEGLEEMVRSINKDEVKENEVLSDNVYFWDGQNLLMASDKDKTIGVISETAKSAETEFFKGNSKDITPTFTK